MLLKAVVAIGFVFGLVPAIQAGGPGSFNDSHLHTANYIQEGGKLSALIEMLDRNGGGRAAVFGIPLQQKWDARSSVKPFYYLHDDAELYYYSAVDAVLARQFLGLSREQQQRLDPMITGFNPTDGYARDHIRRMLNDYPGVFTGIGEFTIKKEVVSGKIAGPAASLGDPALDGVLSFAAEVGLVAIMHCDIDAILPPVGQDEPTYLKDLDALLDRNPKTTLIWAHTGLGRFVKARANHTEILEGLLRKHGNLYMDISWTVVADQIVSTPDSLEKWKRLLVRYPDRFLFGSDAVSPTAQSYPSELAHHQPLWDKLPPEVALAIRKTNYETLFDRARKDVRRWEKDHVQDLAPKLNWPWAQEED